MILAVRAPRDGLTSLSGVRPEVGYRHPTALETNPLRVHVIQSLEHPFPTDDALRVLVDYVYTAEVEVTEDNVQVSQGGGVSIQTSVFNVVRFWGSIDLREPYETFLV